MQREALSECVGVLFVRNRRRTTNGRPYIVPPSPKQVILSGVARYCKRKRHKTKNRHAVELYFCVLAKIKRFRHNMAKTGSPLRFCCLYLSSLFFRGNPRRGYVKDGKFAFGFAKYKHCSPLQTACRLDSPFPALLEG